MLLTLSGRSFIKIQYSSFPVFPVAYPSRIATHYIQYYAKRKKCKVNEVIFPFGCEARAINLDNRNMIIGIFTGGTSVRSKNIFNAISRYTTGKHEIDCFFLCLLGVTSSMETSLSDPIEYVCCCFSTRRLQARNWGGRGWQKIDPTYFSLPVSLATAPPPIPHPQTLRRKAWSHVHRFSPPGASAVDFRDRTGPLRFSCLRCVWSHILGRPAVPGENWWRARHPSTNRKGAGQMPYGSFQGLSDVHMCGKR